MILGIKTDSPNAELIIYDDERILEHYTWMAGRSLSVQLIGEIDELFARNGGSWGTCIGIVAFLGPGSFTGLRIGLTLANTAAYSQNVPIVGTKGEDWFSVGLSLLNKGENMKALMPFYGASPRINKPKS